MAEPKLRLLNFVTASLTDAENESGTETKQEVYDDRPLYQILKENQDKKDAEFNERFKHSSVSCHLWPPKALDEDETEFLDALETYRKQQEQEAADDEARQLTNFHTAIASRTITTEEAKPIASLTSLPEAKKPSLIGKRPQPKLAVPNFIKVKPRAKKAKVESPSDDTQRQEGSLAHDTVEDSKMLGLVAYSDESDGDGDD